MGSSRGLCRLGQKHRFVHRPNCARCGAVNPRWDKDRCALRANDHNSRGVLRFAPCGVRRDDHPDASRLLETGFFPHDFVPVAEVARG